MLSFFPAFSCIKDGADLFQLSMQYNVHISLTSNPLSLLVEGLRGALNQLTEQINTLKEVSLLLASYFLLKINVRMSNTKYLSFLQNARSLKTWSNAYLVWQVHMLKITTTKAK